MKVYEIGKECAEVGQVEREGPSCGTAYRRLEGDSGVR